MKDEIQTLINKYNNWLKDKTILKTINDKWVEITTPNLDRHNDCIQIYVRKENNGFLLTDDGYIIDDLINSGCSMESPKRQELLKITIAGFGVSLDGERLSINATPDNFPLKKHNLMQAMLAVNDLFYLASPFVSSLFYDDVVGWLDLSDIRYTPKIKFTGKSGFDHMFDFVIPKFKNHPERIVQTLNNPKKDSAESLVYRWIDTQETRSADSKLYAILNDTSAMVSPAVVDALKNYELEPVLWSQREKIKKELAA